MAVELVKRGSRVDLTKGSNLVRVNVALGWDTNKYQGGHDFDLDVVAFLAKGDGKVLEDRDFVFYNNLVHYSGAVEHSGDERTGAAEGDDETIKVDFSKVPAHVEKIAVCVTIHDAHARVQNFGMVSNAYLRIDNADTNEQLIRFDLGEDFAIETAVVAGELYKHNGDWKFNAIGAGYGNGLEGLVRDYGLDVAR
ncbi:TerD [Lysinibacillus phage vB_LfM_LysYB1]|nr:TerD [Lysinibacillus phage vB_LfM_LysYB1]WAB25407.1 TerD [Lysinibacillus phage vB_LfM_LysYB2]